jgi:2-oxo-3-hexenedioate decarboxylase
VKLKSVTLFLLPFLLGASSSIGAKPLTSSPPAEYLKEFRHAEQDSKAFSPITDFGHDTSIDEAYQIQKRIVAYRVANADRIAGYKGGLMSAKSLSDKGVNQPITGVLFSSGALASPATANLCGYRRAAFEMKIGYVFGTTVRKPVATVDQVKTLVSAVRPVVDLPDIAYRNETTYGAIDMIAANISSSRFVEGAPTKPNAIDLDELTVSMIRDGAPLTRGTGKDSLGDQWESLRTLINIIVANRGQIDKGWIVLTGKIGDKGAAVPGHYIAGYGPLGEIQFQIQACTKR